MEREVVEVDVVSVGSPDDDSASIVSPTPWSLLGQLGAQLAVANEHLVRLAGACVGDVLVGRQRDLFPLALLSYIELVLMVPQSPGELAMAWSYLDGVILALNYMYSVTPSASVSRRRTAAQRRALQTTATVCIELVCNLAPVMVGDWSSGWTCFEEGGAAVPLALSFDAVDVPVKAGTCDPLRLVGPEVAARISASSVFFPDPTPGLEHFSGFYAGPRAEYTRLCAKQLSVGLLGLAHSCCGGGVVFPVGKSGGRQRVVWHGTRVSEASAPPPPEAPASGKSVGFLLSGSCRGSTVAGEQKGLSHLVRSVGSAG